MLDMLKSFIFTPLFELTRRVRYYMKLNELIKRGLFIGRNFSFEKGLIIDKIYPGLIKIGDNVTISANCSILAHDAGLKNIMGLVRIGRVDIGNNTFIGLGVTILPGVKIGENVIIGAGSIVSRSIPSNSVAAGVPCKVLCSMDAYKKRIYQIAENGGVVEHFDPRFVNNMDQIEKKIVNGIALKKAVNYNRFKSLEK